MRARGGLLHKSRASFFLPISIFLTMNDHFTASFDEGVDMELEIASIGMYELSILTALKASEKLCISQSELALNLKRIKVVILPFQSCNVNQRSNF